MPRQLRVGIIDGGIGGLALAASLTRFGIESRVFERATAFSEVGAGIQMTPNAVKIMRDRRFWNTKRSGFHAPVAGNWNRASAAVPIILCRRSTSFVGTVFTR
jgi:salicylate hydroxylase